jgi:hypothetical protein
MKYDSTAEDDVRWSMKSGYTLVVTIHWSMVAATLCSVFQHMYGVDLAGTC